MDFNAPSIKKAPDTFCVGDAPSIKKAPDTF
jgi:hypothetical protein